MSKLRAAEKLTHLLFIDEDLSTLRPLPPLLRPKSLTLHLTNNFDTARQYLQAYPISIAIIDINLRSSGQESGFEFASWLRESSSFSSVNILFTSDAYPGHLYRETALFRYQALEYLDKPISLEQWNKLFDAYQNGKLNPPLAPIPKVSTPIPTTEQEFDLSLDPDQFLLDPDEWAESVFRSDTQDALAGLNRPTLAHTQEATPTSQGRQQATQPPPTTPTPSLSADWDDVKTNQMNTAPTQPPEPRSNTKVKQTRTTPGKPQIAHQPKPEHASSLFERGKQALRQNHLQVALQAFQRAFQLQPQADYRAFYAWTLAMSSENDPKRLQAAEMLLIQGTQDAPAYEQGHLLLGRFYKYHQRPRDAFESYRIALSYNPQFQEIYREYRLLQLRMTR